MLNSKGLKVKHNFACYFSLLQILPSLPKGSLFLKVFSFQLQLTEYYTNFRCTAW